MKKNENSKKKLDKKKINEELKKLKVKILEPKKEEKKPEEKKEEPEENSLEDDILETEETIENKEFHEFFQPQERTTPLLQKIESVQEETLEDNVASTPIQTEPDKIMLTYSPDEDYSQGESRKYQSSSTGFERVDTIQELPRQELRNPFERERQSQRNSWNPWGQRIEIEILQEQKSMPFGRENKKYKEFKGK